MEAIVVAESSERGVSLFSFVILASLLVLYIDGYLNLAIFRLTD